ncbi:MAG: T9SS type A sorting domain-containing protein [Ferruginibacter sp.]
MKQIFTRTITGNALKPFRHSNPKLLFVYNILFCMSLLPVQRIEAQNFLDKAGLSSSVPVGAYSVRKLSTTYNGPALRVRRDSDHTEQDIAFTAGGDLDQAALLAFTGTGNGFIVSWYDQSGNSYHATQASVASQPRIVNAGVVELNGSRAALWFNGLNTQNLTAALPNTNYPISISLLANTSGATNIKGAFAKFGLSNGIGVGVGTGDFDAPGDNIIALKENAAWCRSNPTVSYPATTFASTTIQLSGPNGLLSTFLNGTNIPLENSTVTPVSSIISGGLNIGGYPGRYATVKESEIIIFTSALSTSDREALECSQMLYYGILTATAGADQHICGSLNSLPLGGITPTYGSGRWVQVSGPGTSTFSSIIDGTSTATGTKMGTYVYSWQVSNGSCVASDNVTVTYSASPTAGINQNICGTPQVSNPLGGNTPAVGTGSWSKASGPGNVIFSNSSDGNATAAVDADGIYIFRWQISGGYCTPDFVDVTVEYNSASGSRPTATISGNAAICPGSSTALTVNLTGTAPWKMTYTDGTTAVNIIVPNSPYSFNVAPGKPGNYTLSALSDANCVSQPADLTGVAVITFSPDINITADFCSLGGGNVKLDAGGSHYSYLWSTGATTQTITVAQSGFYSVSVTDAASGCAATGSYNVGQELVLNGDFSLGNVGFVTQYQLPSSPLICYDFSTALYPEGNYNIDADASLTHCNFWGRDHTQGTGTGNANFMIVNGANTLTQIWRTNNIQVVPNTRYYFSAWALSLNDAGPFANLTFNINGSQYGSTAILTAGVNDLTNNTGWKRFYGQWNSGPATTATISIVNLNLAATGNDFGLDDISFSTIPPVTFAANPLGNGGNSFCAADTLVLSSNLIGGASPFTYNWTGPNSFSSTVESPVILNAGAAAAGLYTLTATDVNGCTATNAFNVIKGSPVVGGVTQPAICSGPVIIYLTGMVPNSNNNSIDYSINGGLTLTATGINVDASGNANFSIAGLSSANNGQAFNLSSISNGSCTQDISITVVLDIGNTGWIGGPAGNWTVAANWCPGIPDIATDVIIPVGTTIYINSTEMATCRDITLNGTASLIINNGTLQIYGNINTPSTGKINAGAGTIEMLQPGAQTLSADNFTGKNISTLLINNTGGGSTNILSTGGTLRVLSALLFQNSLAGFNTNGMLTLASTDTATARIGEVAPGNVITGNVIVERYFRPTRSWRLITSPLSNTGNIFNSWQAGAPSTYVPGKGMFVTGVNATGSSGNGLDYSGFNNYSMKTFDPYANSYNNVVNTINQGLSTNATNAANIGYFAFVRGDRRRIPDNTVAGNMNTTTLSSSGLLQTGPQVFNFTSGATSFALIGNPYASSIDFNKLTMSNVDARKFWVYDPTLSTVGLFVLMDDFNNTGVFTPLLGTSPQGNYIQSSQAFFVQVTGSNASVTIDENAKSSDYNNAFFRPATPSVPVQSLKVNVFQVNADNTTLLADATLAQFADNLNDIVDVQDALKFGNISESLSLLRYNQYLALERRPSVTENDTLFLQMSRFTQRNYRFQFIPSNFNPALTAYLEDSYTGKQVPLSMTATSNHDFTVTADIKSAAISRFRIVFKQVASGPLPVTYKSIRAYRQAENIAVEWKVENETNIVKYEVEKSADGVSFDKVGITPARGANSTNATYSWMDANPLNGNNFYRVRSVNVEGRSEYSMIVKIDTEVKNSVITIFPNPITDNKIGLQFRNVIAGDYYIRLMNSNGQVLLTTTVSALASSTAKNISTGNKLISGLYHLEVTGPDKIVNSIKVVVR